MGEIRTLGDACADIVDCAHKTAPIDESGEYFAVGTPAMRGNVINFDEARRINRETYEQWTIRLRPRRGDLLLAREAPVGPIVRIPDIENVAPGQRTVLLRPLEGVADSRFLFYYLTSPAQQAELLVKASGSTVPHLNVSDVRVLPMPGFPRLDEQRAIADVLGALDDKIAANERIEFGVRRMLAAYFESTGVDREPVMDGEAMRVVEIVDLNPRESVAANRGVVYLEMKHLPDTAMTVSEWSHRAARGGARFRNGDTLLARITPCLENGKTGFVDFLAEDEVGIGSTEFIVLRSKAGVPAVLPYFLAKSPRFREYAIKHMVGTSGRQRLSAVDVGRYLVTCPDGQALVAFDAMAEPLLRRVRASVAENKALIRTRDELLPLLMSGKLRVNDAEAVVTQVL